MKTLITIWTKPGDTFDYLNKMEKDKLGLTLDILFVLSSLSIMAPIIVHDFLKAETFNVYITAIVILISGVVGALFFKFIYAFITWAFAKLLQGEATIKQIRIIIAYTLVPQLIDLVIFLALTIIAFVNNDAEIATSQNPLTQIVIWFFEIRIMIIGLSRYNKYTYGSALINVILSAGLYQGIVFGIKYLIQ